MKQKNTSLYLLLVLHFFTSTLNFCNAEITYNMSGGRFGDNLLAYIHAKWLAHISGCEVRYKPFEYSNQLALHTHEKLYIPGKKTEKILSFNNATINPKQNIVYVVPYFSDFLYEHKNPLNNNKWFYFEIDWSDTAFRNEIKKMISPINRKITRSTLNVPRNSLSVAVHVRRGGGFDPGNCFVADPLKFPPLSYYIEQIKTISNLTHNQPLYCFIFTDDQEPAKIVTLFKTALIDYPNITLDCHGQTNNYRNNTVHDFFALLKFQCLIRPESNYSYIASKLTDYDIEIYPEKYEQLDNTIVITKVTINQK